MRPQEVAAGAANGATAAAHADADAHAQALALAYRYVDARERSTAELRAHVAARIDDEAAVEAAVSRLTAEGYLDDGRYARVFAEDRRALDGWGSERIRLRLRERGVAPELIERALQDDDGDGDSAADGDSAGARERERERERERALDLLRRRFPAGVPDRRARDRALGVLVRKGYESELAVELLGAWAREVSDGDPADAAS